VLSYQGQDESMVWFQETEYVAPVGDFVVSLRSGLTGARRFYGLSRSQMGLVSQQAVPYQAVYGFGVPVSEFYGEPDTTQVSIEERAGCGPTGYSDEVAVTLGDGPVGELGPQGGGEMMSGGMICIECSGGGGSGPPPIEAVVSWYHADHLGSTRATTDEAGAVLSRHDFLPFGTEVPGTPGAEASVVRRKFTGHERDAEIGLDYMLARYYGSNQARFLSVDQLAGSASASVPASWNRYAYALNNPVNLIDPDGRCSAPSGIGAGQVGVCIGHYISAPTIRGVGLGDARGPVANNPNATFKAQVQMVIDPAANSVISATTQAGVSHALVPIPSTGVTPGGVIHLSGQGTASSSISAPSVDDAGNTHLTVSTTATNGLRNLPGAPQESIDATIGLMVTPDGKVGITGGNRDAFPSLEVFSYDSNGNATLILSVPENKPADLAPPREQPISEVEPR
jgi:RHS repeat-associated protein